VTGSATSGGSTAFSTWNAQTATGDTTLSISQIPSHDHPYTQRTNEGSISLAANYFYEPTNTAGGQPGKVAPQGGGGSHNHSLTQSLKYYDFIIATAN
jgi:hypothetical protein